MCKCEGENVYACVWVSWRRLSELSNPLLPANQSHSCEGEKKRKGQWRGHISTIKGWKIKSNTDWIQMRKKSSERKMPNRGSYSLIEWLFSLTKRLSKDKTAGREAREKACDHLKRDISGCKWLHPEFQFWSLIQYFLSGQNWPNLLVMLERHDRSHPIIPGDTAKQWTVCDPGQTSALRFGLRKRKLLYKWGHGFTFRHLLTGNQPLQHYCYNVLTPKRAALCSPIQPENSPKARANYILY